MLGRKDYKPEELASAQKAIKYVPEASVLKLDVGDEIKLSAAQFERLAKACLADLETKFVKAA
jgi:hypothetical protein